MSLFRRWWGAFVTPEPRHAARVPYPRPTFPIIVWDEPDTGKTVVSVDDVTDPRIGPAPAFAPPALAQEPVGRVRAVIVRVTSDEWVRLGRAAKDGQDMGDVLRSWAGLAQIRRRRG